MKKCGNVQLKLSQLLKRFLNPIAYFRYEKEDLFRKFVEDILPAALVLSLPIKFYGDL